MRPTTFSISMTGAIDTNRMLRGVLLLLIVAISSCSSDDSPLICGEVEFVTKFPKEFAISETNPYLDNLMGMVSMKGADSLFIGIQNGSEYFVGIYSYNTGKKLADIFKEGQGPNEYTSWPSVLKTYVENDSIYADFYIRQVGVLTLNLTATVDGGSAQLVKRHIPSDIPASNFFPLMTGDTIVRTINFDERGGYSRRLLSGDKISDIPNLGGMEATWPDVSQNTLGGIIMPINGDSVIVEAMNELNQIMVYSPYDQTLRKTICVGKSLDKVHKDDFISRRNRTTNYDGVQKWNDYVLFLYSPTTERDFRENKGTSELQIFSNAMKPIARISLPILAQSFYINKDGMLYAFNPMGDSETIYKWDISNFILQF